MVELSEVALEELRSRSETLRLHDLVRIAETYHPDDHAGISRETLDAYLEALDYESEEVEGEVDSRLTDAGEWEPDDAIYDLGDGRISVFPPRWHEQLADTTDLTEYVRVIHDDVDVTQGPTEEAVQESGVPEELLFRASAAIVGLDRREAREQLKDLRKRGVLEESTDQHPQGTVRLA